MNRTEYIKKEELISLMAQTSGVSKSTCDLVLSAFCEAAKQTMKEGKGIQIPRFAKIFPVYKEARKGRNPMTGEEIEIAEGDRQGSPSDSGRGDRDRSLRQCEDAPALWPEERIKRQGVGLIQATVGNTESA